MRSFSFVIGARPIVTHPGWNRKKQKPKTRSCLSPAGAIAAAELDAESNACCSQEAEDDCPSATTLDASEIHDSLGSVLPVEFGPPGRAALQGQTEPLGEGDRVDGGRT